MLLFYNLSSYRQFDLIGLTKRLNQILLSIIVFSQVTACTQQIPEIHQARAVHSVIAKVSADTTQYQYVGEVVAHTNTLLSFQVNGRVLQVHVDVGDAVKSGQILASLDPKESQNQLDSMRANFLDAQTTTQLTQMNLQRMKLLANTGAISSTELDQAQTNYDSAQAKQQSMLANVQNAKESLNYNQLIAPVSGIVLKRTVNMGQIVQSGQQVFEIASEGAHDVTIQVSENQRLNLQYDQHFMVQLLTEPNIHALARLRDISPQADPETRTWRARLSLINVPPQMSLGSIVLINTQDHSAIQTIKIPASALTCDGSQPAVFIVNSKHTLILRPVKIDHYAEDSIYIREGITQGERIVTAGVNKLISGEKVILQETDE